MVRSHSLLLGTQDYPGAPAPTDEESITFKTFLESLDKGLVTKVDFLSGGDKAYAFLKPAGGASGELTRIRVGEGYPDEQSNGWSSPLWVVRALNDRNVRGGGGGGVFLRVFSPSGLQSRRGNKRLGIGVRCYMYVFLYRAVVKRLSLQLLSRDVMVRFFCFCFCFCFCLGASRVPCARTFFFSMRVCVDMYAFLPWCCRASGNE